MEEEANPVKDFVFDYISKSEETIQKLITEQKYSEIIKNVTSHCYDDIINLGNKSEVLATLATGLLHFLLTNALLTSQRKIIHKDTEIDIVIPDLKTLEKDPKKTLIICIPKTNEKKTIEQKILELEHIQPEKQNIWLVLSQKQDFKNKSYVIDKGENSFSKIIFDIAKFVNIQGQDKLKILRV